MRECRLVLPLGAGDVAHGWLARRLVADFGGFTRLSCHGAGDDGNGEVVVEDGYAYDVAVPDEPRSDFALLSIVDNLWQRTNEQVIYVRGRDGTVELLARPEAAEVAA